MPELDDLWTAASTIKGNEDQENVKKIERILKEEPRLVNSLKPDNSANPIPLLRALIARKYKDDLLETIITLTLPESQLPLIDYNFRENDKSQGTQRETLIRHASVDLIKTAIKNPNFLVSENENAYSVALRVRKKFQEDYATYAARNPKCLAAITLLEKIGKLDNSIIPMLYKATSDYAIGKKDKLLLTEINNEQSKLLLEDKKESKSQPNLSRNSIFNESKELKELREAELKLQRLRLERETNKEKILSDSAKGHTDLMNKAYTLTKK